MPPYKGKKKAGNHSTLTADAAEVVLFAQKLEEVSKISPGIIRPGGNRSEMSIKIAEQTGCLLVTVRGRSSVQEIRVYTNSLSLVGERLRSEFSF